VDATNKRIKKLMAPQNSPLKRTIVDEEEEEGTSSRKKGPEITAAQGNDAEHTANENGGARTGTEDVMEQPMVIDA
jgi:hypothetical protein